MKTKKPAKKSTTRKPRGTTSAVLKQVLVALEVLRLEVSELAQAVADLQGSVDYAALTRE